MKNPIVLTFSLTLMLPLISKADNTYIFIRHGEKPDNKSGQLTCKGLNRSLSLPDVLLSKYGIPDALYASAPNEKN